MMFTNFILMFFIYTLHNLTFARFKVFVDTYPVLPQHYTESQPRTPQPESAF